MSRESIAILVVMNVLGHGVASAQTRSDPSVTVPQLYDKSLQDEIYAKTGVFTTRAAMQAVGTSLAGMPGANVVTGFGAGLARDRMLEGAIAMGPAGAGMIASVRPPAPSAGASIGSAAPADPSGSGAPGASAGYFGWIADWVMPSLRKLPTIQLTVNPSPPRDYQVKINGEECPATEQGRYAVAPGDIVVSVTRTGRPECAWRGRVTADTTVTCDF